MNLDLSSPSPSPETPIRRGVFCCGHRMEVIETRECALGVRRRRECLSCGCRISTLELEAGHEDGKDLHPIGWQRVPNDWTI